MASVSKGLGTVVWANGALTFTGYGLQGYTHSKSAEYDDLQTKDGDTVGACWFDPQQEITIDALFLSSSTLVAAGATISFNSITWRVRTSELIATNENWQMVRINAVKYIGFS